jgi:hypothetical protein
MWQTAKGLKNKDLTGQFATLPARQGTGCFLSFEKVRLPPNPFGNLTT